MILNAHRRTRLRIGRQFPRTRDTLDVRIYANNWIGLSLVVFGWGVRASFMLHDALREFTAEQPNTEPKDGA